MFRDSLAFYQKYFIIQCKLLFMIFSDHRTGVHFKIPEMADR